MKDRSALLTVAVCVTTACFVEVVEPDDESGASTATGESEDTSDPEVNCGNGTREPGEQCEGEDLDAQTCESLGFTKGTLACSPECTFDVSDCSPQSTCGDGMVQGDEECDGEDFQGRSCESFGFQSGSLLCTPECLVDTSECIERGA